MKKCRKCGKEYDDTWKVCSACSIPLIGDASVKDVSPEKRGRLPGWAWIFMAGCLVIPILTKGGALPMVIGVGAAAWCQGIATDKNRSKKSKVVKCVIITISAWLSILLLAIISSTIKQP